MAWSHKINLDWKLLVSVLVLCGFGVLMVFDASSASAVRDFGDKLYFLKDQVKWVAIGVLGLWFMSLFDYHKLYIFSLPILLGSLAALSAVFIPGIGLRAYGASRWLNFGLITVQPSEIAKLALVIYLSAWFTTKEQGRLAAFALLLSVFLGLILLQPDMGTGLILAVVASMMYFFSEAPLWHFLLVLPVGVLAAGILAVVSPYRYARITTFLNPTKDPLGTSYHISQVLIALGSGGLFGVGLGASRQKYSYLPEATTDSIFAIIGEELGFIGAVAVILLLGFVVWRGFRIALNCRDKFGQLLAAGITSWLAVQALVNLGAMAAIIPLTGVPLPFVSYGGSALVTEMVGIGILLNIGKSNSVR